MLELEFTILLFVSLVPLAASGTSSLLRALF